LIRIFFPPQISLYIAKAHFCGAFCDAIPLSINTAVYLQSFNTRFSVTHSFSVTPTNIAINNISLKTTLFGLHFCRRKYLCIFNHFYAIRPESYRIWWNYAAIRPITPFKVIQGHRVWYQSKAHMRLPISN